MSKLTRVQMRGHEDAEALLSLERPLSEDEIEFVYRHYQAGARHMNARHGAFFTPVEIAFVVADLASAAATEHYVDLGAGIGVLSWALRTYQRGEVRITAVELNPEYVAVGRRLLPDVEWVCGDIFDRALWQSLALPYHAAVGNPPFGRPTQARVSLDWLSYRGPFHMMAMEVALRVTRYGGVFIIPQMDAPYIESGYPGTSGYTGGIHDHPSPSRNLQRFRRVWSAVEFSPSSHDLGYYDQSEWQGVQPRVEIVSFEIADEDLRPGLAGRPLSEIEDDDQPTPARAQAVARPEPLPARPHVPDVPVLPHAPRPAPSSAPDAPADPMKRPVPAPHRNLAAGQQLSLW